MNLEPLMRRALALALKAEGLTEHYPMVGAVLVKGGKIISEDFFARPGEKHAEAKAIERAGRRAKGATLVLNLEPCCHWGRQPPCTNAIIQAGVKKVVAAMTDPNPLVSGRGFRRLRAAGIEVVSGVLEKESRKLNRFFIKFVTTRTPWVIVKMAATADGKSADRGRDSKWISSEAARQFTHQIRAKVQAVMVGIGTVLKDDPRLSARLPGVKHQPRPVIVDERLRIPLSAKVFNTPAFRGPIIACAKPAPRKKLAAVKKLSAQVIETAADKNGLVDLKELMKRLGEQNIARVLCEGGSHLAGALMDQGLVDEIYFFYAPKLLVDEKALPLLAGAKTRRIKDTILLRDAAIQRMGPDFVLNAFLREI